MGNGWISGGVYTPTEAADVQSAQIVSLRRRLELMFVCSAVGLVARGLFKMY